MKFLGGVRLLFWLMIVIASAEVRAEPDWLQFRGSDNRSIASATNVSLNGKPCSTTWSIALPGRCVSGPIVVGNRVVTTSSSGRQNERLHVWCVDGRTGKRVWQRSLWATGRTACHPLSSMASPTPASDGRNLYVLFASNDLVALDLDGNVLWMRGLGRERPQAFDDRGLGSSPLLVDGMLIIQVECQGDPFVMGIEAASGTTRWTLPMMSTASWNSPTRFPVNGRELVVLQGGQQVMVLEPRSGELVAQFEPSGPQIPSPTVDSGTIFLPLGGLTALKFVPGQPQLESQWRSSQLAARGPSPVCRDGRIYVVRSPNIVVCGDAGSGERLWQIRLKGRGFYATPVLAGNYLVAVSQEGILQVVDLAGEEPAVVAEHETGEEVLGSPAVVNGAIYLRGVGHLWKIESR